MVFDKKEKKLFTYFVHYIYTYLQVEYLTICIVSIIQVGAGLIAVN